jgi:hypothetical protein
MTQRGQFRMAFDTWPIRQWNTGDVLHADSLLGFIRRRGKFYCFGSSGFLANNPVRSDPLWVHRCQRSSGGTGDRDGFGLRLDRRQSNGMGAVVCEHDDS